MSEANGRRWSGRGEFVEKKQRRRVLISALVEVLILAVLAFAFCWNRGLGAKIRELSGFFDRPPVTELDVTGIKQFKCSF